MPQTESKAGIEDAHYQFLQRVNKAELILPIINAKDRIVEARSIDSFICGFELVWSSSLELNSYDETRPADKTGRGL